MIRGLLAGFGVAVICATGLFAQPAEAIERGARIRATFLDPSSEESRVLRRTGVLLDIDADAVTLQPSHAAEPLILPRRNVKMLEVSQAESQKASGALLGLAVGAAAGVLIGYSSGDDPDSGFLRLTAGQKATVMGFMLAPLGALVGLLSAPGEQWQTLSTDEIRLGLGRGDRGESVAFASIRF